MFASGKAASASAATYIEDVFSTYLYTGNGSTQTITNGIDLSGKGGMVWIKDRAISSAQGLFNTVSGATKYVQASSSTSENTDATTLTSFNSNGFSLGSNGNFNTNASPIASWTFRKQPKFFDVLTYTGNGANRTISHNLGSVPGCILIKCTSNVGTSWGVYHRSLANTEYLVLNTTAAKATNAAYWNSTTPTSTVFSLGTNSNVNANNFTYVAYLFAHNAGGFGLTGTDNVISCGSVVQSTGGSGLPIDVTVGFEPQWVMLKRTDAVGDWVITDIMRGQKAPLSTAVYGDIYPLYANTTAAEGATSGGVHAGLSNSATGFSMTNLTDGTYVYIAINNAPKKIPTSGASVFQPVAYTGTNVDNRLVDTGIVTDMTMARIRTATSDQGFYTADRMRSNYYVGTRNTDEENIDTDSFMTPTVGYGNSFSAMNGFGVGNDPTRVMSDPFELKTLQLGIIDSTTFIF
jgi:hypothetical protein